MNLNNSLAYTGTFMRINGVLLLVPVIVAYHYGEPTVPFVIAGVLSYSFGAVMSRVKRVELTYGDAMLLSAMTLLLVSLFGAIPFFMTLKGPAASVLIDGYFESVSGYTTTGLSVLETTDGFPMSLLFLRSLSQWIGGIGIIVLSFSALMYGASALYLYRQEQESNRIMPSVSKSAKTIIKIYLLLTLAGVVLLWISGVDLFTSLNDTMTSLSTGGFTTAKVSYENPFGKFFVTLLMIIGSLSFTIHYNLLSGNTRNISRNPELRAMVILLFVGIMCLSPIITDIDDLIFNVTSALTTTGYSSIDFSKLPDVGKLLISSFMIVGGGMGSTAGGIKLFRILILVGAVRWFIRKHTLPEHAVVPFKVMGKVYGMKEVVSVTIFFFIYITVLTAGGLVIMLHGYGSVDSFFVSASAVGTVGLSTIDIHAAPLAVKAVLTVEMLLGRVEIISMMALFGFIFGKIK